MSALSRITGVVAAAAVTLPTPVAATTQPIANAHSAPLAIGFEDDGAAPGCVAGAYRDGEAIFNQESGLADLATRRPLSQQTVFYAASLSKQFTALAVASLAEEGRIDLDADVRQHLPELPDYGTPITPRMLLHHSSGVRDWLNLASLSGRSAGALDKDQAVSLVLRQSALNFEPDSRVLYSNGGYLLLAEIVERVAGETFADHLQRRILAPLGMDDSFFLDGTRPNGEAIAHGYALRGRQFRERDTYPRISGSGGLMTSLADLAAYERAWVEGHRLLTPFVRSVLTTPGTLTNGQPATDNKKAIVYAGGLGAGHFRGVPVLRHGGSADGFQHVYVRFPESNEAIILLCNYAGGAKESKVEAIYDTVLATSERPLHILAPGQSRTYFSPDLERYFRTEAAGTGIALSICKTADSCSPPQRFEPQAPLSYARGSRTVRFTEEGRRMLLSASRAFDIAATEVGTPERN